MGEEREAARDGVRWANGASARTLAGVGRPSVALSIGKILGDRDKHVLVTEMRPLMQSAPTVSEPRR
jgi:hypothetical protein